MCSCERLSLHAGLQFACEPGRFARLHVNQYLPVIFITLMTRIMMIGGASDTPGESRSRSESSTGSRFTGKLVQVWLSLSLGPLFKLLATHHHHPASESLPSITAGRVRVSESGPASGRPGEPEFSPDAKAR